MRKTYCGFDEDSTLCVGGGRNIEYRIYIFDSEREYSMGNIPLESRYIYIYTVCNQRVYIVIIAIYSLYGRD